MNNYWDTQQGTIVKERMATSYKPVLKTGAPFALDFDPEIERGELAGEPRAGGPKEARLNRVALLKDDRECEHLFGIKVTNLGPKMTPEKLKERFSEYGEVGNVYLPKNLGTNEIKGFAYVRYVTEEAANTALEACTDVILEKKRGPVKVEVPSPQKSFFSGHTGSAGITGFTDERPVADKTRIEQVLSLDDCMARNGAPWVSKHELLRLEPHAPLETHDCWSLKITELTNRVDVKELKKAFEPFGAVENCYCPKVLLKDQWSMEPNQGVGYVRFRERNNAEKAMQALNNTEFYGSIIEIELVPPKYWPREATRRYF